MAMHLFFLLAAGLSPTTNALHVPPPRLSTINQQPSSKIQRLWGRRGFVGAAAATAGLLGPATGGSVGVPAAQAFLAGKDEEVSGLVVLRVAEVCNFQEKLLRALAACSNPSKSDIKADQFGNSYCGGEAYSVNPTQIVFGTGVMLKNANLDGNLKLMIKEEVDKKYRPEAIKSAVNIMSALAGPRSLSSSEIANAYWRLCVCLLPRPLTHGSTTAQTLSTVWSTPRRAIRRLRTPTT